MRPAARRLGPPPPLPLPPPPPAAAATASAAAPRPCSRRLPPAPLRRRRKTSGTGQKEVGSTGAVLVAGRTTGGLGMIMVAKVDTTIVHQIGMILDVVDGMKDQGTPVGKV